MAEKKCCCKCGARLFWLAAAVLVVLVAIFARSCAKERHPLPSPQPEQPQTAEERVRARIEERVADTNYMANLEILSSRFEELGSLRAEAAKEFAEWKGAFLSANGEARELAAKAASAAADEAAALEAQLKELFAKDSKGATLLDKLSKLDDAIEANSRIAADYIGARIRKQTAPGAPPAAPLSQSAAPASPPPAPAR